MNQTAQNSPKAPNSPRNGNVASVAARRLVSKARFATVCGVARSTITRACRSDLAPAVVGERIDLNSEAVETWLIDHGLGPEIFEDVRTPAPPTSELGDVADLPLDSLLGMTLGQLGDRLGSDERLYAWVRAKKEAAMARRSEVQLERLQGRLISRTAVAAAFAEYDALSHRLFRDVATTLARRLTAGRYTPEAATALIREQIAAQISLAKNQISLAIAADDPESTLKDPRPIEAK